MLSKATEIYTRAAHVRFAWLASAALAAACGGSTDSQTGTNIMSSAGGPSSTVVAGAPGTTVVGTAGSSAAAGASAAHAGTGGTPTTGSAGTSGSAGMSGAGAAGTNAGSAGKSGSGAAGMSAGGAGSGGAAAAATFSAVYNALFSNTAEPGCFACHGGMANPALNGNFAMVSDKATLFTNLVGTMSSDGGMCKGMTRVKAGDPMSSLLYLKISGTPPCGMEMPPGGTVPAATVSLVKDWITAGAKND